MGLLSIFWLGIPSPPAYPFLGFHPYAFAHAPPISMALGFAQAAGGAERLDNCS